MKKYALFIDDQVFGPFPEDEIITKLDEGSITLETLCAEPGGDSWVPLSEVIKISPVLTIQRKTKEDEERTKAAKSDKLDSELRKLLLLYKLADSITVEKFTEAQAVATLKLYKETQKKKKLIQLGAGAALLVVSFCASYIFFDSTKTGNMALNWIASHFYQTNPEYLTHFKTIKRDVAALEELRVAVEKIKFEAPKSSRDTKQALLDQVVIMPEERYFITAKLNDEAFLKEVKAKLSFDATALARKDNPKAAPVEVEATGFNYEVYLLKESISEEVKKLILEEMDIWKSISTPLWTNKEFQAAINDELLSEFPEASNVDLANQFLRRLKNLPIEAIDSEVEQWRRRIAQTVKNTESARSRIRAPRVIRGRDSSGPSYNKGPSQSEVTAQKYDAILNWCNNRIGQFLPKFEKFLSEKKVFCRAEGREETWGTFQAEAFEKIRTFIESNKNKIFELDKSKDVKVFTRYPDRILIKAYSDDYAFYFFPREESRISWVKFDNLEENELTAESVLMDEKYKIEKKITVGGKTFYNQVPIWKKPVEVSRVSPKWHYIQVIRQKRTPIETSDRVVELIFSVTEEQYNTFKEGDLVPVETLLTLSNFMEPQESPQPVRLYEKKILPKEEKADVKK